MSKRVSCYSSFWLEQDMENMGYLFEYCMRFAKEEFGFSHLGNLKFMKIFMQSNMRREMDFGHPMLISESARESFVRFVEVDCDNNIEALRGEQYDLVRNQAYWVGWAYMYIRYKENIFSDKLVKILTVEEMLRQYKTGHEMDISVFYDKIKPIFKNP